MPTSQASKKFQLLDPEKMSLYPAPLPQVGMPDIDLLTSNFSNKLDRFVAKCRDLLAFTVDALVVTPYDQFNLIYSSSSSSDQD